MHGNRSLAHGLKLWVTVIAGTALIGAAYSYRDARKKVIEATHLLAEDFTRKAGKTFI
ncbi:MAG: hypothetical protein HY393_04665 [Candidatus Diapherotrites archaeon]|nr:hypothetical protein [Candidatus Diapherotrites archaeon]